MERRKQEHGTEGQRTVRGPRLSLLRVLVLLAALLFPIAGSGCVALDSRHISFTATASFLRISKNDSDNRLFLNKPSAYTLAPLGFIGVLLLDVVLLPITGIHDVIVMLRGDPEGVAPPVGSYTHQYRETIHMVIVN